MPKLFVIAALVLGGIAMSPAKALDVASPYPASPLVTQAAADQRLDAQKRVWFGQAIGHILDGSKLDAPPTQP